MEWIKPEEQLPAEGSDVWICLKDNRMIRATTLISVREKPYWVVGWKDTYYGIEDIKCWMPFNYPSPPDF